MIDSDTYRSVLGRFATGVTIITARSADGTDHGMTVSAFCSLSLHPPQVLICIDQSASMLELMRGHCSIGINILSSDQEAYSRRFASEDEQPFEGIAYGRGEAGVVLFEEALAHLECRIIVHHEAGDHTIFIAEVDRATPRDGRPLLYYRGGYAQLER